MNHSEPDSYDDWNEFIILAAERKPAAFAFLKRLDDTLSSIGKAETNDLSADGDIVDSLARAVAMTGMGRAPQVVRESLIRHGTRNHMSWITWGMTSIYQKNPEDPVVKIWEGFITQYEEIMEMKEDTGNDS